MAWLPCCRRLKGVDNAPQIPDYLCEKSLFWRQNMDFDRRQLPRFVKRSPA